MSVEDCWRRLCASVGMWSMNGFGTWAVEDKATGRLLGNVGLFTAWRGLEPEFGEEPEMGWIMATETHGKGLAREAWAIIAPENEPSLKLAEKLGFQVVGLSDYHGEPTVVLKRSPSAAPAATSTAP